MADTILLLCQILDAALKQFKNLAPKTAALLFSVDEEKAKIICLAAVPKVSLTSGLLIQTALTKGYARIVSFTQNLAVKNMPYQPLLIKLHIQLNR